MSAEASYAASSVLTRGAGARLDLETALGATPLGLVEHPRFFSGLLARPDVAAAGMLAVADVAGTRYFDAGLAKRLANLDPVVTASGDRLRFESFSLCNGVHARLDLLESSIDSGEVAHGTTNVDINQPLRTALASVGRAELLHLDVGTEGLSVSTPDRTHHERQVTLPDRWVRGFAESPALASVMTPRAEMDGSAALRWLAGLPRAVPGPSYHLVDGPGGLRRSARPLPGSVHLAGAGRLSAAARVARHATRLTAFGNDEGASGWVLDLPGARLTLLLSPEPYRGFSGEGGLLRDLGNPAAEPAAARLLEFLAWEPYVDPDELAALTGLAGHDVRTGLGYLAVSGKVGYDLADARWFHRELPLAADRVEKDNPRLRGAKKLIAEGAVARDGDGWLVTNDGRRHWVRRSGPRLTCTCPWWGKYDGGRGPCKHVLAVEMLIAVADSQP